MWHAARAESGGWVVVDETGGVEPDAIVHQRRQDAAAEAAAVTERQLLWERAGLSDAAHPDNF